jgi:uncharacterized membrane protein YcaP (DUF421 family)
MWTNDITVILLIIARTLIVYLAVMIGIRLSGKRELGQMTALDFVLLLLVANTVQNAMTGPDTSVNGGLIAAATLLIANFVVTRLILKNRAARKFIDGSPTMLIYHGKVIQKHLDAEKITIDDLNQALREHAVAAIEEVSIAVLEIDGSISVVKNDEMPKSKSPHHRIRFLKRP